MVMGNTTYPHDLATMLVHDHRLPNHQKQNVQVLTMRSAWRCGSLKMLISLIFLPSPSSFSTFFVQTKGSAPVAAPTFWRCSTTFDACMEHDTIGPDRPWIQRHKASIPISLISASCAHFQSRNRSMKGFVCVPSCVSYACPFYPSCCPSLPIPECDSNQPGNLVSTPNSHSQLEPGAHGKVCTWFQSQNFFQNRHET